MPFRKLALIAATALAVATTSSVIAQSNVDGAIAGKAPGAGTVTVSDPATGLKRTTTTAADGSFRVASLPPAVYTVTYADANGVEQTTQVNVVIGTTVQASNFSDGAIALSELRISESPVNPIDFARVESVTIMTAEQIDLLPVARNPTAVALLAPGTTLGDTAFGNLASFGGASVAENAYFVNGFNISNFRNGLDPATVPFEFYNQFEVKTGAYSAEFGRSTGGVIAATTNSGSNQFHAGANVYWTPDAGRSNAPDVYYVNGVGNRTPFVYNGADYNESWEANIHASGPLWKDKAFFYGLYQLRNAKREDVISSGTQHLTRKNDDPFWGAKIDLVPFDQHRLEYTVFRDVNRETQSQVGYDFATKQKLDEDPALNYLDRGGTTHIGRYTGTFGDAFTLSALYGKSTQDRTDSGSLDSDPYILDGRSGSLVYVGGNPNGTISQASDEREAMRLDLEYRFELAGTHRVRVGFDRENNLSVDQTLYSGDVYYRYYNVPSSGVVTNYGPVPAGATALVRSRVYRNGGSFEVKSDAWYAEDNWSLMEDRLNLRIGLRSESFENLDSLGATFIKVTNQMAPRIGASFDLFGDKKTKLSINFGRYHLPIASNTNIRLAGGEYFTEQYNVLTSTASDGTAPVLGAQIGELHYLSDGSVHDRREIVDMDIKPMYQDEWVVGIQRELTKSFNVGARFINRQISGTAMDDMIIDHALVAWAQENGFPEYEGPSANAYVLANPGRPIHMFWDFSEDGVLDANEEVILTPEMLGYPKAERKYYAVELFAEKVWDGKWTAQASYTWAQSYGNYEGWVLSDNGQDDAGITTLFDSPTLMRNSYGYLPNDRRHQVKLFGAYALTSELRIGTNVLVSTGRAKNMFVTADDPVASYGADYLAVPRGSAGRMPTQYRFDLSLTYKPKWADNRLTIAFDVFNILNGRAVTETVETVETAAGGREYTYGLPSAWQTPRYMRLSAGYDY